MSKPVPTNWVEYKKQFTQEQEDSLWQYFIDHSRIQKNGYFGIMFYVRDVNDFWKRLHARASGNFIRYDKLKKATAMADIELNVMRGKARQWNEICVKVDKTGNRKAKIALFLNRKTRDYLHKSYPQKKIG